MVHYDDFAAYIRSETDNKAKAVRIEAIITALEDSALESAVNQNFSEYQLDDGQSRIRTTYRNTADIFIAIKNFEQLRNMYLNRINGNVTRLVDLHSHLRQ